MKVNYVLMYGIPYVRYKEFEKFEDISKFLVHKGYVNYSIFKKLEDKEEIEMIYRDNDIHYLEDFVKKQDKEIERLHSIIKEVREYIENLHNFHIGFGLNENDIERTMYASENNFVKELLEILDKENKGE